MNKQKQIEYTKRMREEAKKHGDEGVMNFTRDICKECMDDIIGAIIPMHEELIPFVVASLGMVQKMLMKEMDSTQIRLAKKTELLLWLRTTSQVVRATDEIDNEES